ncbi:MAG: DUF2786 domain-containing protein [Myxococcales bacterium]|nr:DUF2786 domain-containing protein [Myxococcales bacterium]MCB9578609.1 DUF2786 domain-containing protein [Polyangiaceae bacterium]
MPKPKPEPTFTAALERATLFAIRHTWNDLNGTFFRWRLEHPVFRLSDTSERLGAWDSEHRTLELSKRLLVEHGWGALVEVLKHEMAHQFVDEVLNLRGEPAHGPAFQEVCKRHGFDARASGAPHGVDPSSSDGRVLERITKLLALAQSSNVHEAQAAMSAAQRLMLKHNIDSIAHGRRGSYTFRHLGEPSGRVGEAARILALILSDHFFVEAIWVPAFRPLEGKRGSVLEVCGTLENVELAEYVHTFLTQTSERLWKEYKRDNGIKRNTARRTYVAGVMAGFRDKLKKERTRNQQEGLVWVGDPELYGYLRARHPRMRTTQFGGGARTDEFSHGREAGRNIVLHRGVRKGASKFVHLLPGRRDS